MIRRYRDADLADLLEVWYAASRVAHPFLTEEFLDQERGNIVEVYLPKAETWVFEKDRRVAGFLSLLGNEVGAIFVRPELHGRGIGRALMDRAMEVHDRLEVEVFKENEIGRAFYDRYGFKPIREHVHEETGHEVLRLGTGGKSGACGESRPDGRERRATQPEGRAERV